MAFALDPRLAADCSIIGSNGQSLLLLMEDSRYPWFIVVPKLEGVSEWFDLAPDVQLRLHQDCVALGHCVKQAYACEKINIAALGNIVRQLHIHVVGRETTDPAWPGPVWGHSPAIRYTDETRRERVSRLYGQDKLPFNTT